MGEAKEEGNPIGRPAVSTNLDTCDLSDTEPPTKQHTPADMRPPPHKQQRTACLVWVQSEKMHLTVKRLEGPGYEEV